MSVWRTKGRRADRSGAGTAPVAEGGGYTRSLNLLRIARTAEQQKQRQSGDRQGSGAAQPRFDSAFATSHSSPSWSAFIFVSSSPWLDAIASTFRKRRVNLSQARRRVSSALW